MTIHDNLQVEWATIDGEGLVRVFETESFKDGFFLVAQVGMVSENLGYYPEVLLTPSKLTVTIPPNDDGLDHQLAHAIDRKFSNEAES